jgi:NAD(P)-dependent dehydrogenase (short-subunit alcohol dehydrogenase family)
MSPGTAEPNADTDSPRPLAVITGAGSGIGLAMAHEFSRTHRLLIADVAEERLSAAQQELAHAGSHPSTVVCDVTQLEHTERLARRAFELGPVSVLVHAAGISPSMGDAVAVIRINYSGTANMLAAFEPILVAGSVTLCIASMSGYRRGLDRYEDLVRGPFSTHILECLIEASLGQPGAAYALSKRAVMRLVEWQARRWAARGARILSISPGVIDTPMGRREIGGSGAGSAPVLLEYAAIPRLGAPEEIARLAAFLAGPQASFMTGCDVLIDGGALAGLQCHAPQDVCERWDHPWR